MKKPFKKFNILYFLIFFHTLCFFVFFKQKIALSDNYDRFKISSYSTTNTLLNIGGTSELELAGRTQNNVFRKKQSSDIKAVDNSASNSLDFISNNKIHFDLSNLDSNYDSNTNSGIKYGGFLQIQFDVNSVDKKQGASIDKSYGYIQSFLGKIELGNNYAVNSKMKVGPASFARGAGGINGNYLNYVNYPAFCNAKNGNCFDTKFSSFIVLPQSPIAHGVYSIPVFNDGGYNFDKNKDNSLISDGSSGTLKNSTKINYYTPRISGWQLGLSLTPDTENKGFSTKIANNNDVNLSKVISYGLNYSNAFDNLGLALSATAEQGNYKQKNSLNLDRQNLQAYDFAFTTTYLGATFGASYGNWGNSLQVKRGDYFCGYNSLLDSSQNCQYNDNFSKKISSNSSYYTIGLAYQFGHFATSITYLNSNFQNNDYSILSFGSDYKITKDLTFYLELNKYQFGYNQLITDVSSQNNDFSNEKQLNNSQGHVVLTGLLFSF